MSLSSSVYAAETVPLGEINQDSQSGNIAFVGATLVSPHLASPITNATVLVRGGVIEAIGPATMKFNNYYKKVDLTGRWLVPGYIDSHVHFFQSGSAFTRPDSFDFSQIQSYADDRAWVKGHMNDTFARYIANGVTAVVDMCGPTLNFEVRAQAAKTLIAPRVATAGACVSSFAQPILDLKDNDPVFQLAASADQAVALMSKQLQHKPDLVKIMWVPDNGETPKQLFALFEPAIALAKRHNIAVAVHATELENAKLAIKAGADILVHSVMFEPIDDEFISLVKTNDVVYMPTLAVYDSSADIAKGSVHFKEHEKERAHPDILESFLIADQNFAKAGMMIKMMRKYVPMIDAPAEEIAQLSDQEKAIIGQLKGIFAKEVSLVQQRNLKRLYKEGVTLALGTDAGNPGVIHGGSLMTEMVAWQKAGIPIDAILKAATLNSAKVMGQAGKIGSIEVGKLADMVVLTENPMTSVEHFGAIEAVIKQGFVITTDQIEAQLR